MGEYFSREIVIFCERLGLCDGAEYGRSSSSLFLSAEICNDAISGKEDAALWQKQKIQGTVTFRVALQECLGPNANVFISLSFGN
jgi:hypothetical protein